MTIHSITSPLTQPEEPLVITVDREGTIFIQKTEVPLDNLVPRLLAITENNRETRIYLRGDRRVDYGRVVQVLGPVKAAGFTGLALIIDPEDEKAGRAADKDGEDRSG